MAAKPMTAAEHQRIRDLHATGTSLSAIAKDLGRSKDTVSNFCKRQKPPLSFDTTQVAAATQSHKDRAAALRATLELRLLDEATKDLDAKTKTYDDTYIDGNGAQQTLTKTPSPRDRKDLTQSAGIALSGALKIAALDNVDSGKEQALDAVASFAESVTRAIEAAREAGEISDDEE